MSYLILQRHITHRQRRTLLPARFRVPVVVVAVDTPPQRATHGAAALASRTLTENARVAHLVHLRSVTPTSCLRELGVGLRYVLVFVLCLQLLTHPPVRR